MSDVRRTFQHESPIKKFEPFLFFWQSQPKLVHRVGCGQRWWLQTFIHCHANATITTGTVTLAVSHSHKHFRLNYTHQRQHKHSKIYDDFRRFVSAYPHNFTHASRLHRFDDGNEDGAIENGNSSEQVIVMGFVCRVFLCLYTYNILVYIRCIFNDIITFYSYNRRDECELAYRDDVVVWTSPTCFAYTECVCVCVCGCDVKCVCEHACDVAQCFVCLSRINKWRQLDFTHLSFCVSVSDTM